MLLPCRSRPSQDRSARRSSPVGTRGRELLGLGPCSGQRRRERLPADLRSCFSLSPAIPPSRSACHGPCETRSCTLASPANGMQLGGLALVRRCPIVYRINNLNLARA